MDIVRPFPDRWMLLRKMGVPISQSKVEMDLAYRYLTKREPVVYVEIGSYWGGSALVFGGTMPDIGEGGLMILIDARDRGEKVVRKLDAVIGQLRDEGQEVVMIDGFSQAESTVAALDEALAGRKVGAAFIDGSHKYKDVMADYANLRGRMDVGGLMLFHDIFAHRLGSFQAWKDTQRQETKVAEIHDPRPRPESGKFATGIGVVTPFPSSEEGVAL